MSKTPGADEHMGPNVDKEALFLSRMVFIAWYHHRNIRWLHKMPPGLEGYLSTRP